MYFTFGTDIDPFLVKNFNVQSTIGLVTLCVGLIALAVVFESLKTVHFMTRVHRRLLCCSQPDCKEYINKEPFMVTFRMKIFDCIRTLGVYMFQMLVGYILMCAIMTFNGYIFFATVGGYGLGYWLFGLTMMHLSAKNLLKSQDNPIRCKNCTRININKKDTTEDSISTDISDDIIPSTSSVVEVEIHNRV
ncbi:probable low affinity copper uptake protein 2 [Myzus persicae]|uniref:probable low affinity copper uptake protein 2 n=1 Tax=Myzus persicae TaxID=13164 RepID=UPI000B935BF6|nr:probable low affinity copper uptake protein 2 [Myzus persicae]